MLEIRNVHKTFNLGTINEKHALNGVNLKLDAGDFVTVIGGNGAGKSTLSNLICGFLKPGQGRILFGGEDIADWSIKERGEKIGGVSGDLAEQSEYLFLVFFCHNSSRISLPKLSVTISILRNSHPPSSASGSPVS